MEARRLALPSEFLDAAGPLLLEDEARHNLMLGLAGTLRDLPGYYPDFQLWIVEDGRLVVAAALQTPPYNLVLARPSADEALAALADAISSDGIQLPGVTAALPEADAFADAWESRSGTRRRRRMAQRIYRVAHIRPLVGVPGRARVATAADRDLLVAWSEAFAEEATADAPADNDPGRAVDARLQADNAGFMLWEDGEPVSMAAWGGETPHGIRIGLVYTPPERRRRGYGSAVTAAVSAEQLAAGRQFCFLYTDLANATSNKIYMDIGYERVCDSVAYAFDTPADP